MTAINTTRVRVRYAPSPTGFLHIGGARSALYNYLFAKHYGGDFILRVEDTDLERNVEGGELSQINDLIWLGILPDESPLKPNPQYAPYRQTERLQLYQHYAQELLKKGFAYHCYCSEETLDKSREEQLKKGIAAPKYDRKCLHLTAKEKEAFIAKGIQPTIRLKLEDHHQIKFVDLVRGEVTFNNDDIGDWVLMKSNGIPTYNFAVVIDDHLMHITHVLRGEEHLSNTPKQIQLYEYFNWHIPHFGHMTLIVNEEGKKLSKRDNNIIQFISQYRDKGYLPEAIFNFILLLGWTPSTNQEFFTKEDAIKAFDEKRLSSSPSMFDIHKLSWMNGAYLKKMPEESYLSFVQPYLKKALLGHSVSEANARKLALMFKEQLSHGEQLNSLIQEVLTLSLAPLSEEGLQWIKAPETQKVVDAFTKALTATHGLDGETVKELFKKVAAETNVKGKALFMPIRLYITGLLHGAELTNILPILGKEEVLRRLKRKV